MIITLGGRAGSGTSSAGRALAKRLGYKFYSAGEIRRRLAKEKGLTLAELNKVAERDAYSDKLVDEEMKRMAETQDALVVDAWLGFYFFPDSIKIFLDADIKVRAKRLVERGNFEEPARSVREAVKLIKQREEGDAVRFEKRYGVNIFDQNHFDLVIDTSHNTVEQTVDQIYRFVQSRIAR
ncbi:MAG TPA: hypothetical protein ENL16_03210 [Candidatus Woesearchaeota archaeon]|nr:hypothetical protein [Candidatus Woesearchaeota archaeon]